MNSAPAPVARGRAEHVVDPADVGQQRLERAVDHELDADRGGQVQDHVGLADQVVDQAGVGRAALDERRPAIGQEMVDVAQAPGAEVVQQEHVVPQCGERVAEVRADEAGAAGDEVPHAATSICSRS